MYRYKPLSLNLYNYNYNYGYSYLDTYIPRTMSIGIIHVLRKVTSWTSLISDSYIV